MSSSKNLRAIQKPQPQPKQPLFKFSFLNLIFSNCQGYEVLIRDLKNEELLKI
jgi:hypothetical protein